MSETKIMPVLENSITPGIIIPKPQAKGNFIVKGWGKRRGEHALIYIIPNHRMPSKPYEKGIAASEWGQAFDRLMMSGEFSRQWFEQAMPACAKEGGCNFTTIGGIFQLLGYAENQRGVYPRKDL
jgi:hypothetical protein